MRLLSRLYSAIQDLLFPFLEGEYGALTDKQQQLVSILEVIRIEEFLDQFVAKRGRPLRDRTNIARAFVLKSVYNCATTRQLIEILRGDPILRRICLWKEGDKLPHESTFSRAFAEFAQIGLPQRVHEALVKQHQGDELKGHVSRDSTAIEGREKAKSKEIKAVKPPRKRGRPKKGEETPAPDPSRLERQKTMTLEEMKADLPQDCDWGCKKSSQGKTIYWKGFKLHLDCVDGQIPVSTLLTSASVHDSQAAIPLATMTGERVTSLYDLMDAAYDAEAIREHSRSLGHVPIIDQNPRKGEKRPMDPPEKERYKERTSVERVFGRLKDEFGAQHVRVKGATKVMAHLMFGVLALAADQLLRLVQ